MPANGHSCPNADDFIVCYDFKYDFLIKYLGFYGTVIALKSKTIDLKI